MLTRSEFLARRKSGIGGSDVAAVLGVSPWKTPYQLYLDKIGDEIDETTSARMEAGTRLEPVIADWFADRHPELKIQRRSALFRHERHPELIANIDRYIVGGGILECKTYTGFDRDNGARRAPTASPTSICCRSSTTCTSRAITNAPSRC